MSTWSQGGGGGGGGGATPIITDDAPVTDRALTTWDGTAGDKLRGQSDWTIDASGHLEVASASASRLKVADGLVAQPGLQFKSKFSMGLWRSGNECGWVATGVGGVKLASTSLYSNGTDGTLDSGLATRRWQRVYTFGLQTNFIADKTADYTATEEDHTVVFDGVGLTATLDASPGNGAEIEIINNHSTAALTVAANTGQTMNGSTSIPALTCRAYRYRLSDKVWFCVASTNAGD